MYPLAAKITLFEHTCQPGFNKHLPAFKDCIEAFKFACQVCGGRDLVEEFLAAKIWPLSLGWYPLEMKRVKFSYVEYEPTPVLGLKKPEGPSDEAFVAELEQSACDLVGPWDKREYDSFVAVCCHEGRINRRLTKMGVRYEPRPVPTGPVRRMQPKENVGSDI